MMGMKKLSALIMVLMLCLIAVSAMAQTWNVKSDTEMLNAIAAAQNEDVIKLTANITGAGVDVPEGKNITIDFNGHTYTVSKDLVGSTGTAYIAFRFQKNGTITLKNGTIKATHSNAKMLVQNYAALNLVDMLLDGSGLVGSNRYVLSNNNCTTNITGTSSIRAKNGDYAFDVYDYAPYYSSKATVNVQTTGDIIGKIEVGSSKGNDDKTHLNIKGVGWNSQMNVVVENGTADLNNLPGGVTVKNNSKGKVVVDGVSIAKGNQYIIPYPVVNMPKTGDESSVMLWAFVMVMAIAGFVMINKKTVQN